MQTIPDFVNLQIHNLTERRPIKRTENDDGVQTVQELRSEELPQLGFQLTTHLFVLALFIRFGLWHGIKTNPPSTPNLFGPHVGGHDDDSVTEINLPPPGVIERAFLHNLQQHVEGIGMSFFDFIKHDDRVRSAANGLSQLAGFLVADVTRRRTDETRHRMALHELRHIELHQRILTAKEEFRQRFGELRLANPGRSQENKGPDRSSRVFEASSRAAHGFGDSLKRLALTDNALTEMVLHIHQALSFLTSQLTHGDARPHSDNLFDIRRLNHKNFIPGLHFTKFCHLGFQDLDLLFQLLLLAIIFFEQQTRPLDSQFLQALENFAQAYGTGRFVHPHT